MGARCVVRMRKGVGGSLRVSRLALGCSVDGTRNVVARAFLGSVECSFSECGCLRVWVGPCGRGGAGAACCLVLDLAVLLRVRLPSSGSWLGWCFESLAGCWAPVLGAFTLGLLEDSFGGIGAVADFPSVSCFCPPWVPWPSFVVAQRFRVAEGVGRGEHRPLGAPCHSA